MENWKHGGAATALLERMLPGQAIDTGLGALACSPAFAKPGYVATAPYPETALMVRQD